MADPKPAGEWLYDEVQHINDQVAERLTVELEKWPLIGFLMRHFGSLLFGASQRLIDRHMKTGEQRSKDEAVIRSCVRLFNDCYAGYLLLRRGIVLQAIVVLRSAFEVASQGILFMEREDMAKKWLDGRRIQPREVREMSSFAAAQKDLYNKLTRLSHPNTAALLYYAVPTVRDGKPGMTFSYGGSFLPKEMGQVAIQFLWAQLVFLEVFYSIYSEDLQQHGLLWRRETEGKAFDGKGPPKDFGWKEYLGGWRETLMKLTKDHSTALPDDWREISLAMSDLPPEAHDEFRRGYEDAKARFTGQQEQPPGEGGIPSAGS